MMATNSRWTMPSKRLRLGKDACIYIPFEGKTLRWINATPEADATVSVSMSDPKDHRAEDEMVLRFLSLLAWENSLAARIKFGVTGGRTPYSKAHSSRGGTLGIRVDPIFWPRSFDRSMNKSQRAALALYREAMNSSSTFMNSCAIQNIRTRLTWRRPGSWKMA